MMVVLAIPERGRGASGVAAGSYARRPTRIAPTSAPKHAALAGYRVVHGQRSDDPEEGAMLDDVTLLPVRGDVRGVAYSEDALYCETTPALAAALRALEAQPGPPVFRTW